MTAAASMTRPFGAALVRRDRVSSVLGLVVLLAAVWAGLEWLRVSAGLIVSMLAAVALLVVCAAVVLGGSALSLVWVVWAGLRWRSACRACGIGRTSSPWRDGVGARSFRPAWAWWTADGHTLRVRVLVPAGMTAAAVLDAAPALAAALRGVRGWGIHRTERCVEVVVVMRDPLRASRPAETTSSDGLARWARDESGADLVWSPAAGHTAIQGTTGSGKSSTVYTLLGSLAQRRDVLVCGSDISGLVLGPWRSLAPGLIATGGADLGEHAAALEGAVQVMTDRLADLAASGRDVIRCSPSMPWLVVVIEEAPGLLAAAKPDREVHARIITAARRLKQEGRKVGVVVVTIAQRMSAQVIDADARSQEAVRITHRVDTSDALRMLHDGADLPDLAEVRQWPPGLALVEMPGRRLARVRVDHTTYERYREVVATAVPRVQVLDDARDRLDDVADLDAPAVRRRPQPKKPRSRASTQVSRSSTARESDPMAEQSRAEDDGSSGLRTDDPAVLLCGAQTPTTDLPAA